MELNLRNGDTVVDPAVLEAVLDARGTLVTKLNVRGCLFTVLGGPDKLAAVLERCPNITFIFAETLAAAFTGSFCICW